MIAKLIVHGRTREDAINKMRSALGEMVIHGVKTNIDFHYGIMTEKEFANGDFEVINEMLKERCN